MTEVFILYCTTQKNIVPLALNKIGSRPFVDKQHLLVVYSVHYLAAALRFCEPYSSNGNMTSIAEFSLRATYLFNL